MAEPFVQTFVFNTPNGSLEIASVVMDQSDFDALVDELLGLKLCTSNGPINLDESLAHEVKSNGHIPIIGRGTKTEFLFERYDIACDRMSVIVRGQGPKVFERYSRGPNPEVN